MKLEPTDPEGVVNLKERIARKRQESLGDAQSPEPQSSVRVIPAGEAREARASGGFATPTLNHMAGPNPQQEYDELEAEECALVARLEKVVEAKVRLRMHMALAGTLERPEMGVEALGVEA